MQEEAEAFLDMIEEHFKLRGLSVAGDFISSLNKLDVLQGCAAHVKKVAWQACGCPGFEDGVGASRAEITRTRPGTRK